MPDRDLPMSNRRHVTDVRDALDQLEIFNLQTHYSMSIDAGEYDNLDDVFLPDGVADYGPVGQHVGVEAIKDACRAALDQMTSAQHMNGNHWAEIDGDEARAGCYFRAHVFREGTDGGDHFSIGGRYDDELVRTEAGWRISRRSLTHLWSEGNPAVRYGDR